MRRTHRPGLALVTTGIVLTFGGCRLTPAPFDGPAVDIPRARYSRPAPEIFRETSTVLSVPNAGALFLGNSTIQLNELPARINAMLSSRPPQDRIVYIRAGKDVKYGALIEIIGKIREAGINYVGIVASENPEVRPAILEAAILPKLSEAEMSRPIAPPAPRALLADFNPDPNAIPPPQPPPTTGPKSYTIVQTARDRFETRERLVLEMIRDEVGPEQPVSLNRQWIPLPALGEKLDRQFEYDQATRYPIYVRAPKEKSFQEVVSALDQIAGVRAAQIVLHIDYLDGDGPNLLPPKSATDELNVEKVDPTAIGIPGSIPITQGVDNPPPPAPAAAAPPPKVVRVSSGALMSNAIKRVEPAYPAIARAARASGQVVVEVTVDERGDVMTARVLTGHPLLAAVSIQAARQWKFRPTLLSGAPVKTMGTITFYFKQ